MLWNCTLITQTDAPSDANVYEPLFSPAEFPTPVPSILRPRLGLPLEKASLCGYKSSGVCDKIVFEIHCTHFVLATIKYAFSVYS